MRWFGEGYTLRKAPTEGVKEDIAPCAKILERDRFQISDLEATETSVQTILRKTKTGSNFLPGL